MAPASTNYQGVQEAIDGLRRDVFASMRNMIDALLEVLESRLSPEPVLRPRLRLEAKKGAPPPPRGVPAPLTPAPRVYPPTH